MKFALTRYWKRNLISLIAFVWFLSTPLLTISLHGIIQSFIPYQAKVVDLTQNVNLVILGTGNDQQQLSFYGKLRIAQASLITQAASRKPQLIILSGGKTNKTDKLSEAQLYKSYIDAYYSNLAQIKIIEDNLSSNTKENAKQTALIMHNNKLNGQLVIVTNSFHILRSYNDFVQAFRSLGLNKQQLKISPVNIYHELSYAYGANFFKLLPSKKALNLNILFLIEFVKLIYQRIID